MSVCTLHEGEAFTNKNDKTRKTKPDKKTTCLINLLNSNYIQRIIVMIFYQFLYETFPISYFFYNLGKENLIKAQQKIYQLFSYLT